MTNSDLIVAIVDDDETVRRALRRMISSLGYRAVEFATGEDFLVGRRCAKFNCVLVDLYMPGLNGIEVVSRMRSEGYSIPAILITGRDERKMRERCLAAGAAAYLVKPVDRETALAAIQALDGIGSHLST